MEDTKRQEAMAWWNNLAPLQKTQICENNTKLVGSVRRWESLTGREIETIFKQENNIGELARIGTLVRITMPDGKCHKFKGFMDAIRFLNATKVKIDSPIGIPDYFTNFIDRELIAN